MNRKHRKLLEAARQRQVPVKWEDTIQFDWFRTFPFWQRVKILFGYNVVVLIGIAVQHKPGRTQPWVIGRVTKHIKPDDEMRAQMKQLFDSQPHLPLSQELER